MGFDWNVFRIMADVSHTLSKCILIFSIHSNKSAEGRPKPVQFITSLAFPRAPPTPPTDLNLNLNITYSPVPLFGSHLTNLLSRSQASH